MPETECTHEYYEIKGKLFCRDCGAGPEVQPGFKPPEDSDGPGHSEGRSARGGKKGQGKKGGK